MYYKSIEGSGMPDATHSTDDKEIKDLLNAPPVFNFFLSLLAIPSVVLETQHRK